MPEVSMLKPRSRDNLREFLYIRVVLGLGWPELKLGPPGSGRKYWIDDQGRASEFWQFQEACLDQVWWWEEVNPLLLAPVHR